MKKTQQHESTRSNHLGSVLYSQKGTYGTVAGWGKFLSNHSSVNIKCARSRENAQIIKTETEDMPFGEVGMPEKEGYSDYLTVLSNTTAVLALITGFMFATLTVLLTALPDLSRASSQLVLFIAAFFLDVFVFLLLNASSLSHYYCKMPPVTKRIVSFNLLLYLALMFGMGMVTTAMFFAYNLTYLALAQLAMWVTMSIITHFYVMMPISRLRRSRASE